MSYLATLYYMRKTRLFSLTAIQKKSTHIFVGVSRGYTDYHQGRAIHKADSRIH